MDGLAASRCMEAGIRSGLAGYCVSQQPSVAVHASVGGRRVLELVDRNRPLAADHFPVTRRTLAFFIGAVAGLADQEVDLVDAAVLRAAEVVRIDLFVENGASRR